MKSRTNTLKEKLGVYKRVVDGYIPDTEIEQPIDYAAIHEQINLHQKLSLSYLKQALDVVEADEEQV